MPLAVIRCGVPAGHNWDRKGTITVFDADPAATATFPASINARGDVTGDFFDGNLVRRRGFVRSPISRGWLGQTVPASFASGGPTRRCR